MRMKKIEDRINGRFKKVESDASMIASKQAEFEMVTKDAIATLEQNLVTLNKVSIMKVEKRVNIEVMEQNISRSSMQFNVKNLTL
tara:strand:- start:2520 stop:2774 length:255 start_codon:yes stop_codon:yes gene_type:complete